MTIEILIGIGLVVLSPFLEHWFKSFKLIRWIMLSIALSCFLLAFYKSCTKQDISNINQSPTIESSNEITKLDTSLAIKTIVQKPIIKPTPKLETPEKTVPKNTEYYDIHPENMQGGTIIGKNNAPIFQNPHITIDANGISIDTNAVFQNGRIVAKAFDPRFNLKDSTFEFSRISHDGSFNNTLDFQYQGNTFHIKSMYLIREAEMGGQKFITIDRPVCNYSGIINGITRKGN
jgi:hypothetical protein